MDDFTAEINVDDVTLLCDFHLVYKLVKTRLMNVMMMMMMTMTMTMTMMIMIIIFIIIIMIMIMMMTSPCFVTSTSSKSS